MELPPNIQDEAAYLAENFEIPITTALKITLDKAKKAARKKERVAR